MDPVEQFEAVISILERVGVEVRETSLGGAGGGLCEVRGRKILLVDVDADQRTRLERCVRALADLPEAQSVYLPPVVRELMDQLGDE